MTGATSAVKLASLHHPLPQKSTSRAIQSGDAAFLQQRLGVHCFVAALLVGRVALSCVDESGVMYGVEGPARRKSEGEGVPRFHHINNTCRWTFCIRRKQKKQRRHYVIARPYGAAGRQKLSRKSACHLGADCGKLCASLRRRWFFLASQLEVRCEALANVVLPFFNAGVYDRTFDLLRATGWLARFDCRTPFWRR